MEVELELELELEVKVEGSSCGDGEGRSRHPAPVSDSLRGATGAAVRRKFKPRRTEDLLNRSSLSLLRGMKYES